VNRIAKSVGPPSTAACCWTAACRPPPVVGGDALQQQETCGGFVNGSAVGVYGLQPGAALRLRPAAADDFLGRLCKPVGGGGGRSGAPLRVVTCASAFVARGRRGALGKMLPVFRPVSWPIAPGGNG